MELTISGPIGSGKSTVAKIVSDHLSMRYISTGDIFREKAKEMSMSVEDFNRYAENHLEIDRDLDNHLVDIMKKTDNIVIDSRLAGWMSFRNKISALRIFITAGIDIRIQRISQRENISREDAADRIRRRESSERQRYRILYGIDIQDTSIYDLILKSDNLRPEIIADEIVKKTGVYGNGN